MRICIIRNSEAEITTSFFRIVDAVLDSNNTPIILSRNRETEKLNIKNKKYKFEDKKIDNYEINIPAKRGAGLKNIFQLVIYQFIVFCWLVKNRKKYDAVHSFDLDAGLPTLIASKILRFKHIYHIADFYTESRNMPNKLKNIFRSLELKIIDKSNYTIICNEERIGQIKGAKQENVEIVHNVPVLSKELLNYIEANKNNISKHENIKICYVGKLSENRFILKAMDVIKNLEGVELNIAGVGPVEDEVREMAKNSNNIVYHGKMQYEDALKLYLECDLMFAIYDPSVANHKYSAPNKIYEAMILEKPIIVAKGTGMDNIVNDNNMGLVIDYNEDEFKKSLEYLLENRDVMDNMGQNASNAYENYCWDKMKNRLVKIYNQL